MLRVFAVLFIFVACTDKKDGPTSTDADKSKEMAAATAPPAPVAKDVAPAETWVALPDVVGIDLSYQKASEEGRHFRVTGLEIVEAIASYPVDQFPEDIWGPLLVKIRDSELDVVFNDENKDFQVTYYSPTKENIKTKGLCNWKRLNPAQKTEETSITSIDPTVFKKIIAGAERGHKMAFEAIMATEITAVTPKELVKAQVRLKYMKEHGCTWK